MSTTTCFRQEKSEVLLMSTHNMFEVLLMSTTTCFWREKSEALLMSTHNIFSSRNKKTIHLIPTLI